MQTKLQELTDKIYQEGVQKARSKADELLDKARQEAADIVAAAQKEAQKIVEESEAKSRENARSIESDVKFSSTQALGSLKQSVSNLITLKVVEPALSSLFSDKQFLSSLLLKVVEGFVAKGDFDLKVLLPEAELKQLDQSIKNSFATELNKGLVIEGDSRVKNGFKVGPKDGSYLIHFTENDFQNFFQAYIRSKTSELLFEK